MFAALANQSASALKGTERAKLRANFESRTSFNGPLQFAFDEVANILSLLNLALAMAMALIDLPKPKYSMLSAGRFVGVALLQRMAFSISLSLAKKE